MTKRLICGPSPQPEITLCGFAFDAFESGDHDEPIVEAKPNETITCPECRAYLENIRNMYPRGYVYKGTR